MARYVVRFEWEKCIGSAVCEAVCPLFWKVVKGKSTLKDSVIVDEKNKIYEVEIGEKDVECNSLAAAGCPPKCIRVIANGIEVAPKR